ncbi:MULTISPECIES: hypothetical protein [unclassified Pseudoalteromonas]|uniref:hypothetical protein n=1 Tax=unclassified Pseudoalteromonas TaxID=194690 RepID=UPI000CF6F351|nr:MULTISPECIES: hypothetical protein [unclassified Pseudoalteromonas]MBS3797660.1 hypothetical protein [Pseudoalteromonas sp. BDTF-M6]
MKSKIILSLFVLVVFLAGLVSGFYAGMVGASASMSAELYAGGQTMRAALFSLEKNDIEKAKATLCNSIKTRINILELSSPTLSDQQLSEVSALKQHWLHNNIDKNLGKFREVCI